MKFLCGFDCMRHRYDKRYNRFFVKFGVGGILNDLLGRGSECSIEGSVPATAVIASSVSCRWYSSTGLSTVFPTVLAIGTKNPMVDSTHCTIVCTTALVLTRLLIAASNTVGAGSDCPSSISACSRTLSKVDLMPLFELKHLACYASSIVDSTVLTIWDCTVLMHLVRRLWTTPLTSVSVTILRSGSVGSISHLVSTGGSKTEFHGDCHLKSVTAVNLYDSSPCLFLSSRNCMHNHIVFHKRRDCLLTGRNSGLMQRGLKQ